MKKIALLIVAVLAFALAPLFANAHSDCSTGPLPEDIAVNDTGIVVHCDGSVTGLPLP